MGGWGDWSALVDFFSMHWEVSSATTPNELWLVVASAGYSHFAPCISTMAAGVGHEVRFVCSAMWIARLVLYVKVIGATSPNELCLDAASA